MTESEEKHNKNKMMNKKKSTKSSVELLDPSIFDEFTRLSTSITESERPLSTMKIIEYYWKNTESHPSSTDSDDLKKSKVIDYVLKRLVRGLGSSTTLSRTNFYSAFVAVLKYVTTEQQMNEIFTIMDKELHVGKEIGDKEDSNAIIGQILITGAILQSEIFNQINMKLITKCTDILTHSAKHKNYHSTMCYTFLVNFLHKITKEQFDNEMWPIVKKTIGKQWEKQTLNSIYLLLEIQKKYPSLIDQEYLKASLKTDKILTKQSYKHINRLFFDVTSMNTVLEHPVFNTFEEYLLSDNVKLSELEKFWFGEVNETLQSSNKVKEIILIKFFIALIKHFGNNPKLVQPLKSTGNDSIIVKFLTPRFIKMITNSITINQHDERLCKLHAQFFNGIDQYISIANQDSITMEIIKKLILHPGIVLIEKYMQKKYIHIFINRLTTTAAIRELYMIYKNIILGLIVKDPNDESKEKSTWLNIEKQFAIQMMLRLLEHKCVSAGNTATGQSKELMDDIFEWRTEELKFFLTIGIFHCTNDGTQIITKDSDNGYYTKDLWFLCKNTFYQSLQIRIIDLKTEKSLLLTLVKWCNDKLIKKNSQKYLRYPLSEAMVKHWQRVYNVIDKKAPQKTDKKTEEIQLIFHILLLQMLLQLFREPEMATEAILDLEKCMENANALVTKSNKKKSLNVKNKSLTNGIDDEPEWIDVVVDLFLHLLSKNLNILRAIVDKIFPHLCSYLSITNIRQILSVLDMKNKVNPLTNGNDDDENADDDDDDSEDDNEQDSSNENISKGQDNESSEEESNADSEDDKDDDDDDIMDNEEGNVSDQLRDALSTALRQSNVTTNADGVDDMESIDLDDMDDEEAERLDRALSEAFQLMKKPLGKQGLNTTTNNSKKLKTKLERINNTTLMHFRIRVLDLIEIYLKSKPTMEHTIVILKTLIEMLNQCVIEKKNLQTLDQKLTRTLKILYSIKNFQKIGNITEMELCKTFAQLVDTKTDQKIQTNDLQYNNIVVKCCIFLIVCSQQSLAADAKSNQLNKSIKADQSSNKNKENMIAILKNYLQEFVKSRNPTVNYTLFLEIFKLPWLGVWTLGKYLCEFGLQLDNVRVFRRIQTIELLTILYKNYNFITAKLSEFTKFHNILIIQLQKYLMEFKQLENQSSKEFSQLLEFLLILHKTATKHNVQLPSKLNWKSIGEDIQHIRLNILLISIKNYVQFCRVIGIKVIHKIENKNKIQNEINKNINNNIKTKKIISENVGEADDADDDDGDDENKNSKNIKQLKRKQKTVDHQKEKKLKKENRLKIASEGFNGFSFSSSKMNEMDVVPSDN